MRRAILFPVVFALAVGTGVVVERATRVAAPAWVGPPVWHELAPEDVPPLTDLATPTPIDSFFCATIAALGSVTLSPPRSIESSPKFTDLVLGCRPADSRAWRNAALARIDAELERDSGSTSTGSFAFVSTATFSRDWLLIRTDGTVGWRDLDPFDVAAVESAAATLGAESGVVKALARLARLEAKR